MTQSTAGAERRRSFRIGIGGSALLWRDSRIAGRYRVTDLSIGGCQLTDGPPGQQGNEYALVLAPDSCGAMRLRARIVRQQFCDGDKARLGLEFCGHSRATEDRIHDLVVQRLEQERPFYMGRVLVADADPFRRRALRDAIEPLGYEVIEAETPVDAVWEMENGPADFSSVFVARWLGRCDGRDLVRFIGERYLGVHRVLIADRPTLDKHTADDVLVGPFDRERLREVVPSAMLLRQSAPVLPFSRMA